MHRDLTDGTALFYACLTSHEDNKPFKSKNHLTKIVSSTISTYPNRLEFSTKEEMSENA